MSRPAATDRLGLVSFEPPHLPGDGDGYDVCRRVREFSNLPIIMLTAKARDGDTLRGFELGADDYPTKPLTVWELMARRFFMPFSCRLGGFFMSAGYNEMFQQASHLLGGPPA